MELGTMAETYGERLARLMDEEELTFEQLAERTGIPSRTLQDIVGGKVKRPQRQTRELIDAALGAGTGTPTDVFDTFPEDVQFFLGVLGVWLSMKPKAERTPLMYEITRDVAE
jgi:transcriptional regulator with XRE-family HTH domain